MVDSDKAPSITMHSSWRGILFGLTGAIVVFVVGLAASINTAGAPLALGVAVLGGVLVLVSLLDYPVASTFGPDRVTRRAILRRHHMAWDDVDQLTRTRPSLVGGFRGLKPGGLAAKVGRRRYLLVDQCESLAEFDRLGVVLEDRYSELALDEMIVPPESTDPTWTYRRRRWADAGCR